MITRTRQDPAVTTWKPFATSTPLKVNSKKTKTDDVPQKKVIKAADTKALLQKSCFKTLSNGHCKQISEQRVQSTKKLKRNKSSFYFDVSSSSSEDDNDDSHSSNNGPRIKIDLVANTEIKTILKRNVLKEKIELPDNGVTKSDKSIVDNDVIVRSRKKRSSFVTEKLSKETSLNGAIFENQKFGDESNHNKLDHKRKTSSKSSNSKFFNENKEKRKVVKENEIISQHDENKNLNESKKGKISLKNSQSSTSNESSLFDLPPTTANNRLKNKHKNVSNTKEIVKDVNVKNQNSIDQVKDVHCNRKRAKPIITDNTENKIKKKKVKTPEELKPANESVTHQKKVKHKSPAQEKNISHQLFSDSIKQDLINSLDLTALELDNQDQDINSFCEQKYLFKSTKNTKKSMRVRQQPKEFWLPKKESNHSNKVTTVANEKPENELVKENTNKSNTSHLVSEKEEEPLKEDLNEGNLKKNFSIRSNGENGKFDSERSSTNEVQNKKEENCVIKSLDSCKEQPIIESVKVINKNIDAISKSETFKKPIITKEPPNKTKDDVRQNEEDENKIGDNEENNKIKKVNSDSLPTNFSDVFKQLNQLSTFENCLDGVQTAECWSLKNFKCGILKVSNQCQISNKTNFPNSYFGGILIKGCLKMKIGSRDLEIKQGDMAFVPPLTEWWAIGTHESDSLFYYWCGRFKT